MTREQHQLLARLFLVGTLFAFSIHHPFWGVALFAWMLLLVQRR